MSLCLEDLHPVYRDVGAEEARMIANLGAEVYLSVREPLRAAWAAEMTAEEGVRADVWRAEGRRAAVEELRERLAAAEAAIVRAATAEGTITALRSSAEEEVGRRVAQEMDRLRAESELAKMRELSGLKEALAKAVGQTEVYEMLAEAHDVMRNRIVTLEAEVAASKAAATKSSHAIGKQGEAVMMDMIQSYVLPRFAYSDARDVSALSHMGDVHLWALGPTGNRTKVMIDVKKYATPVQKGEVEKLYSDLDGDDADAGVMISLDSVIYSKSQFQIVKTKANKPCMFLTFEKLDDGIRQEVLCWAIRVLVGIVAFNGSSDGDALIANAQAFIGEMSASLNELETCVRSSKGLYEMLRKMKEKLAEKISSHAQRVGITEDVLQHVDVEDMKCRGVVRSGERCKSRRGPTGLFCQRHQGGAVAGNKPDE